MIRVTIQYRNGDIESFIVEGHADYGPEGEDICCAGVSAVTQTALLGLIRHLPIKPAYDIEKGSIKCKLPPSLSPEAEEKARIILSTMEAGLLSMQEAYRDFIQIDIRRC
ncbi:ribosomal-processing cysteine protease Prp [Syntrophomonas erecta]